MKTKIKKADTALTHKLTGKVALYLSIFGSLCWEAAAIWGVPTAHSLSIVWASIGICGFVAMFAGFIAGIFNRRSGEGVQAIVIALFSPPIWIFLIWAMHPFFEGAQHENFPFGLWLYFQIPLVFVAISRSKLPSRLQRSIGIGIFGCLACFVAAHQVTIRRETAQAPHISASYLSSIYERNDTHAIRQIQGKRIVITGEVGGQDEGLFGDSPPRMSSNIQIDSMGDFDNVSDGQETTLFGTLKGEDAYGMIHMTDCRTVH